MPTLINFAACRVDLEARQLFRDGQPVTLRPKTFAVLGHLVSRPGELVTKDDLLEAVWPDVRVTRDVCRVSIRELRRALDDDPAAPRFLETVRGRGYRWIAPPGSTVNTVGSAPPPWPSRTVVGRAAAFGVLADWRARAERAERVVGFVVGDAGVGKTTLVDAFLAQIAGLGWPCARADCRELLGVAEPYLPLLEAIPTLAKTMGRTPLLDSLRAHAPSWLAQLPALTAIESAPPERMAGTTSEHMLREFTAWIGAASAATPFVLVLEDLHWCDHATLDVLTTLAHGRAPARLLVIGTYRPVDALVRDHPLTAAKQALLQRGLAREHVLAELDRESVREWLAARLGDTPPPLAEFVFARCEGHPLFMVALVEHLIERGALVHDAAGWRLRQPTALDEAGIPDTLRAMIESQLAAVGHPTRALLETASVVGVEFDAQSVASDADEPEIERVEECCETLVRQGHILRTAGESHWPDGSMGARYAFRHALHREVLYARVPPARRRRLHQTVGERLERGHAGQDGVIVTDLAAHFELGGDRVRAVSYLGRLGEIAQKRMADREAVALLGRALDLLATLPPSPERSHQEVGLRFTLSPSLAAAKGYRSAELAASADRMRALCAELGETPAHVMALLGLFTFEVMRGSLDAAAEVAERALALGERVAPFLATIGHVAVGLACCFRGDFRRGRTHLEQVPQNDGETWSGTSFDPPLVAASHLADRCLSYLGLPEQALARARDAVARAERLGHPVNLALAKYTLARTHAQLRDPVGALAAAEEALAVATAHGIEDTGLRATMLRLGARSALGEQGTTDELCGLLGRYEQFGMVAVTTHHLLVVEVAVREQRLDDALRLVLAARTLAEQTGERMDEAEIHRWHGELFRLMRGDDAAAEVTARFTRARDVAVEQGARWFELRATVSLAQAWARTGRRTAAAGLLATTLAAFTEGWQRPDLIEAQALLDALR